MISAPCSSEKVVRHAKEPELQAPVTQIEFSSSETYTFQLTYTCNQLHAVVEPIVNSFQ